MTLSIMKSIVTLSVTHKPFMLGVILTLSIMTLSVMKSIVMLSATHKPFMLGVIMLSVVAPITVVIYAAIK
jgi:hypothetical protein